MYKVILFGASKGLQSYMNFFFQKEEEQIVAILDNNRNLWGKWNGIDIIPPSECLNLEFDKIIIVNRHFISIINQLKALGVKEDKIVVSELYLTFSGAFAAHF